MPCHPVKGGWKFGNQPTVHPTKEACEQQAKAIYASGYRDVTKPSSNTNKKVK